MTERFSVAILGPEHDKASFSCGVAALDRYLAEQAGQDVRRRSALCYVAHLPGSARIAGYYTLAAGSVPLNDLPAGLARRLPRYPAVPVARIGRLAVASEFQGKRLGGALLWDGAKRAIRAELAVYALVVDAKDERAAAFYLHHGFIALGASRQLMLPVGTLAQIER